MKKSLAFIAPFLFIVCFVSGLWYLKHSRDNILEKLVAEVKDTSVRFYCDEGEIAAKFATSTMALSLPDGRAFNLGEVRSGSGIRYSAGDIEFVGKGEGAFVTEKGNTIFNNCLAADITKRADGMNVFRDRSGIFSFVFPGEVKISGGELGYTQTWRVDGATSGQVLSIATLPRDYIPEKTNFSEAKFVVGTSADPEALSSCLLASEGEEKIGLVEINGVSFSKFHFTGAGAGNFYDTMSYRTIKENQCYAAEYTVHSTNIGNYSPDQGVKEFNKEKVGQIMEGIVSTLSFSPAQ